MCESVSRGCNRHRGFFVGFSIRGKSFDFKACSLDFVVIDKSLSRAKPYASAPSH